MTDHSLTMVPAAGPAPARIEDLSFAPLHWATSHIANEIGTPGRTLTRLSPSPPTFEASRSGNWLRERLKGDGEGSGRQKLYSPRWARKAPHEFFNPRSSSEMGPMERAFALGHLHSRGAMHAAVYETAAVCKHLSLLSHIGEMTCHPYLVIRFAKSPPSLDGLPSVALSRVEVKPVASPVAWDLGWVGGAHMVLLANCSISSSICAKNGHSSRAVSGSCSAASEGWSGVNGIAPSSRPWHSRNLLLNHTRKNWCPQPDLTSKTRLSVCVADETRCDTDVVPAPDEGHQVDYFMAEIYYIMSLPRSS